MLDDDYDDDYAPTTSLLPKWAIATLTNLADFIALPS
jgi:hypothetical protein